jgi:DNA polymerase-3 subunit delta
MSQDLNKILRGLREEHGPSVLLLFGDDFRVREASRAILNLVTPGANKGLNVERYEGRSCVWDEIEAALMTPSLFASTHAVVVDDAPYFVPPQRKGDLLEKALALWAEGQHEESGHAFMGFLSAEGWTAEQWFEAEEPTAPTRLAREYGADVKEMEAVWRFCREREFRPGKARSVDHCGLEELIDRGMPEGAFLIMLATQVDRRSRLFKKMAQLGRVLDLSVERDRSGRIRRDSLAAFLDQELRQAEKRIEPRAREMMLTRSGDELWAFHQEIEKLVLYAGDAPVIRADDVEQVFIDQAEGWVFDLTDSLGRRDILRALSQLRRLLDNGEYPLRLLGAIASEVRRLLQSRELLDRELAGVWRRGISFKEFQRLVAPDLAGLPTKSPYVNYLSLQRAEQFRLHELNTYRRLIQEADARLKAAGQVPQMVMERLLIEMHTTT